MPLLPLLVRFAFPASEKYYLHLLIQILLWSLHLHGLVADGPLRAHLARPRRLHGHRRLRDGAAVELRRPDALARHSGRRRRSRPSSACIVGYPCFRLRITGHYFALLTLALTELVRLCIVGLRDYTGGSLGTQPARYGGGLSLYAVQFEPDRMLAYYIAFALWLLGLYIWLRVDASMDRYALDAASQDEDAAAIGRHRRHRARSSRSPRCRRPCARWAARCTRSTRCTSAPTPSPGLGLSLNIVFAVIAGGMWVLLGPTVGAVFTQVLAESLRVAIQGSATAARACSATRRSPSTR